MRIPIHKKEYDDSMMFTFTPVVDVKPLVELIKSGDCSMEDLSIDNIICNIGEVTIKGNNIKIKIILSSLKT